VIDGRLNRAEIAVAFVAACVYVAVWPLVMLCAGVAAAWRKAAAMGERIACRWLDNAEGQPR
jgi:hypothetical protein